MRKDLIPSSTIPANRCKCLSNPLKSHNPPIRKAHFLLLAFRLTQQDVLRMCCETQCAV